VVGHHSNAQQDLANLADVWAPRQDMSNRDSMTAPILTSLQYAHALLLADYKCIELVPAERPVSGAAPAAIADPANTQNPTAGGTRPSKPPSALPSLVVSPLSMLSESSQGEGRPNSSSEVQQHDNDRPPADLSQRIITAHLKQCWKAHQYMLGHITLARSEEYLMLQSVQRIPVVPKDDRDTRFNEYFPLISPVDPNAQPVNPAALAEKKKV